MAAEHSPCFTTVPAPVPKNIAIMRLQLGGDDFPFTAQQPDTVQRPSNMANGMCLDRDGSMQTWLAPFEQAAILHLDHLDQIMPLAHGGCKATP